MKAITLEAYAVEKATKRSKIGVSDKLHSFLHSNIAGLKKTEAYEIVPKDFLGSDVKDFHYYGALKMLKEHFSDKLEWDFTMAKNGRASAIRIKVK